MEYDPGDSVPDTCPNELMEQPDGRDAQEKAEEGVRGMDAVERSKNRTPYSTPLFPGFLAS
jgi:hypothetical protein